MLRHVHKEEDSYVVRESLNFRSKHRKMTEEATARTILKKLEELGLDCEYLRRQGHDESGIMAGVRKGASSVILEKYPIAMYIHSML